MLFQVHAYLWKADRAYRWTWIIWPQCLSCLVVGLFAISSISSPTSNRAPWAQPANSGVVLQAIRDKAYESKPAFDQLEAISNTGNILASVYLATLYDPSIARRSSFVAANAGVALKLYKPAAEAGLALAQFNSIVLLSNDRFGVQNLSEACRWAKNADNISPQLSLDQVRIDGLKSFKEACEAPARTVTAPTPAVAQPLPPPISIAPERSSPASPSSSPPSAASLPPALLRQRAESFVSQLYSLTSSISEDDADSLANLYDDTVNYFGEDLSRDEVMARVRRFLERWPSRNYRPRPDATRIVCDEAKSICTVVGIVQFDARSIERNARSSGEATFEYQLQLTDPAEPKITGESGSVLTRNVTALQEQNTPKNFIQQLLPTLQSH